LRGYLFERLHTIPILKTRNQKPSTCFGSLDVEVEMGGETFDYGFRKFVDEDRLEIKDENLL
jgi:hypothetical protein